MMRFLRYSLATVCFAASAGCLVLWGWTASRPRKVDCAMVDVGRLTFDTRLCNGEGKVGLYRRTVTRSRAAWAFRTDSLGGVYLKQFEWTAASQGYFATGARSVYFPLWYPALCFALTGVGVLRFRRQFSIRAALIAVGVVAALLGMAVIL